MPADIYLTDVIESELARIILGYQNVYEVRCRNPLCQSIYFIYR